MDFSQLNDYDRMRMMHLVEQKQLKDSLRMYTGLVDRCFMDCVHDFTSKSLNTKEEQCVAKCSDKFFKHSQRVGMRFAELNSQLMQQQQQQQQQIS